MLGGVRNAYDVAEELAADIAFWGRHGVGMWSVREAVSPETAIHASDASSSADRGLAGRFLGIVGLHLRPDGMGMAIRFALLPDAQGRG